MDKYDPEKRVGLSSTSGAPGTTSSRARNPGFLYQQNTLRDALVAALNLNIFHTHADRVRMANIAQMVNVLQAMILTDKEKMLLTPTYHVFEMYKPFQGATSLPVAIEAPKRKIVDVEVPAVTASAARDKDGRLHVALTNLDPRESANVTIKVAGATMKKLAGRVLTSAALDAHNTFAKPKTLEPAAFDGARVSGDTIKVTLPAKSVVVLSEAGR